MPIHPETPSNTIPAVRVTQWLDEWKGVDTNAGKHRRRPEPHFYLFSISAAKLKALSGVYRRKLEKNAPRSQDLGIQRAYEKDRSDEIREFIRYGWPWSELSASKRRSQDFIHLQKPGWLPTAIVVNILTPQDERHAGTKVHTDDLITVESDGARPNIVLPKAFNGSSDWNAKGLPPIEIIDGQHRLLAFEGFEESTEYELPVVAFCGLDLSWQAYLFWTINIKPKRINASFAFDLYPLLRTEDWLEHFEGPSVYREARAQELTEALWAHPKSPWHERINMLGESGLKVPMASQAAWIRSLMATYVKSWETKRGLGGLFGTPIGSNIEVLRWTRTQQAAFLIFIGNCLRSAIAESDAHWATALRGKKSERKDDPAFSGAHSLLATDQGIRGFLSITNDIFYLKAEELELDSWEFPIMGPGYDEESITHALRELASRTKINSFAADLASALATYDWRTSSAPGQMSEEDKARKASFRGSGGYKELRRHLLLHLSEKGKVGAVAKTLVSLLRY